MLPDISMHMSSCDKLNRNCEEELPKKSVGRQLTDRLPTVYRQLTNRLTDRLRKKKNCGKNEQLT